MSSPLIVKQRRASEIVGSWSASLQRYSTTTTTPSLAVNSAATTTSTNITASLKSTVATPKRRSKVELQYPGVVSQKKEDIVVDALGERILELLLVADKKSESLRDSETTIRYFRWKPLISRHNLEVLRTRVEQCCQGNGSTSLTNTCWGMIGGCGRYLVNEHRPTRWSSAMFFARLLAFSLIALYTTSTFALISSTQTLSLLMAAILGILVDWDDLQKNQYLHALKVWGDRVYRVVDSVILQGRLFAGRDWNEHGYVFTSEPKLENAAVSSRDATLWKLPPPKDKPFTRWSSRTVQHMAAIDYCYTMLEKERLRKQEKRRLKREEKLVEPFSDDDENGAEIRHQDKRRSASILNGGDNNDSHIEESRVAIIPGHPCDASENLTLGLAQGASREAIELIDRKLVEAPSSIDPMDDAAEGNMAWIDVGARIGMRILNSEHIQRAMASQETKDRIMETMGNLDPLGPDSPDENASEPALVSEARKPLSKPIHSMWTSPEAAAVPGAALSMNSYTDHEDLSSLTDLYIPPVRQSYTFPASPTSDRSSLPPMSPRSPSERIQSVQLAENASKTLEGKVQSHFFDPLSADRNPNDGSLGSGLAYQTVPPPGIQRIGMPESLDQGSEIPANVDRGSCLSATPPVTNKELRRTERTLVESVRLPILVKGRVYRRTPLQPGVKVAVPIFPVQPRKGKTSQQTSYQMTTVVSSSRIYVGECSDNDTSNEPNCLSVTVKLEKFFLRNGEFAELTFRVMDEWSPRYMPRHSKVPIGSCVATSFGVGVLVGWRVEDDCHVIRSLWQCRGPGSSHAYMNRQAIHVTTAAAVGFRVQTMFGWGIVRACTNGGKTFGCCRFFVEIREDGRHKGNVLELNQKEILSCRGAQFIPVIEHVREAAIYQIQLDNYTAALREQRLEEDTPTVEQEFLQSWSACADILWHSFLKAVEEDKDFDDGVNDFMTSIIKFLDRLDRNDDSQEDANLNDFDQSGAERQVPVAISHEIDVKVSPVEGDESAGGNEKQEPGFWIMNDLFGGVFKASDERNDNFEKASPNRKSEEELLEDTLKPSYYDRAYAVLRTLMKIVSIARASSVNHSHFRLALAIFYDFLLFVRTIVTIQERNTSVHSLKVWKRAWEEIISTFGPIKERLESIGRGIAHRMEKQGKKAKIRVLKFVDKILGDERLLFALEQGEWDRCLARIEIALVEARVIEESNLLYYRKAAKFVYDQVQMVMGGNGSAATRNSEKLALLAHLIQSLASPRRSILKVFCRDDMLELFERILVRAYYKEEIATRMLTIHAANFHSLRHLRMLKDFSVAGRIWIPLLDAADEEFSWLVSTLPDNSKGIMCPLSSLFSLCVAQFHKINAGDLSKDWLAFLLDEESVRIIHEIDMLLILALEAFSSDIHEMITVLPYYPSIDDDILKLMDEVNVSEFLREASSAIDDPEKLSQYIREKATIAIERFLNYLPKMSIPVEKRELGDGWVLSCNGDDGGGLTFTDVTIKRENLVCQIMGGDTLFFPMFSDGESENATCGAASTTAQPVPAVTQRHDNNYEESILDHIRELILNAQRYGCWKVGVGGVSQPPTDRYAASVFQGLPVTNVLNCSIDLWRNLEIDDDELLEIAIMDISYHIQLQKERDESMDTPPEMPTKEYGPATVSLSESTSFGSQIHKNLTSSSSFEGSRRRFNPRVDPTVLFLEIKRLTLNLDNFFFRIEKGEKRTIFDPVFAGRGMLSLQNVSIRLRVECAKERVKKPGLEVDISTPILQLRDLEVTLDKLQMTVTDTGFGSDWILNKAVEVFEDKLTEVVEANLKDQIQEQAQNAIENLNSYFLVNPSLLLNLLGISMEDLDENVVWV